MIHGSILSRPWLVAFLGSLLTFFAFAALRFATPIADGQPLVVALLLCFLLSAGLGFAYPSAAWPGIALWSSLAFWLFLLWAAYLEVSTGGYGASALGEALAVVLAASVGAWVGGRHRRRAPPDVRRD